MSSNHRTEGHVLIVDDDDTNLDILRRRLERVGYQVSTASNGQEVLNAVGSGPGSFEIILLDIMMPGIDGLEALQRLRQSHTSSQLPVIMVTAKDSRRDIINAFKLGANDYVTKPIDFPVLFARVAAQLNLSRTHRQLARLQDSIVGSARAESIGRMATELAQEIQAPIKQLGESVEALLANQKVKGDPELDPELQAMSRTLRKVDKLFGSVGRFNSGEEFSPVPTQPNLIVENCLEMLSSILDVPAIKVTRDLADNLPEIPMDRDLMEKAIINVLVGALGSVQVGSSLQIQTKVRKLGLEGVMAGSGSALPAGIEVVEIEVVDDGQEIPTYQMGQIFEGSATARGGLGLTVSRHIVQKHNGRIALLNRSESPGGVISPLMRRGPSGPERGVRTLIWLPAA